MLKKIPAVHDIAVLVLNGATPFDLGIACEVFTHVRLEDGTAPYRVRVCGETAQVDAGAFILTAPYALDSLLEADTVVVVGIANPSMEVAAPVTTAIRRAWENGARLASICTGAFVLGATGLLDGRRATGDGRRATGNDPLAGRFRPGETLPGAYGRAGRPVRRRRAGPHVGRSLGRIGHVPAPDRA